MINPERPDYENTPVSLSRPHYGYAPRQTHPTVQPAVSIITPYYNTSEVFLETVRNVQAMSFQDWEWVIVDDGSTDTDSLARLTWLERTEPRARVIHQTNSGPAVARNRAAKASVGRFIAQLDSDDLIEPTFIEKCIWMLETQPQFAFCNAYNVTFGSKTYLWQRGFHEYEACIQANTVPNHSVMRREAFFAVGGFDESVRRGHEDWDLWLSLAGAGYWGYTIPEFLTWYRRTGGASRLQETEADKHAAAQFRAWLRRKHSGLHKTFPHPRRIEVTNQPYTSIPFNIPVENYLERPQATRRLLLILPALDSDAVSSIQLDRLRSLAHRGYQCTVVATDVSRHVALPDFAAVTPDIFCLDRFLPLPDYPRFLSYLVESRGIAAVLMSQSTRAYGLLSYLRSHHPEIAFLDDTYSTLAHGPASTYPAMSLQACDEFDTRLIDAPAPARALSDKTAKHPTTLAAPGERLLHPSSDTTERGIFDAPDITSGDATDAAIRQAITRAQGRTTDANASAVGRHTAHIAIEHWRASIVSDMLRTNPRAFTDSGSRMRVPLKRRLIPFGTRRYDAYEHAHAMLRAVTGAARRALHRKIAATALRSDAAPPTGGVREPAAPQLREPHAEATALPITAKVEQ